MITREQEAEVLYRMYLRLGTLQDGSWTGGTGCDSCSGQTQVSIEGNHITVTYDDGFVSSYTHQE